MSICTIYVLKNSANSKVYVGQTWSSLKERWHNGYTNSVHLLNAIKKYGSDKFFYETLAICSDQKTADYLEDLYITEYDSINSGYNIRKGGSRGRLSLESRRKMSEAHRGVKRPPEHCRRIADGKRGIPRREETKRKLSLHFRKTTPDQDKIIVGLVNSGKSKAEIALMFGLSRRTISNITKGIGRK